MDIDGITLVITILSLIVAVIAAVAAVAATYYSRQQANEAHLEVEVREVLKRAIPVPDGVGSDPDRCKVGVVINSRATNPSARGNALVEAQLSYRCQDRVYSIDSTQNPLEDTDVSFSDNTSLPHNMDPGHTYQIALTFILNPSRFPQEWFEDPPTDFRIRFTDSYARQRLIPLPVATMVIRDRFDSYQP